MPRGRPKKVTLPRQHQRSGQPEEITPSCVFLASDEATYVTGQTLHPNGGTVING